MFVANKALDVGEQCLPFAAVIGETTVEAKVVMKIKTINDKNDKR